MFLKPLRRTFLLHFTIMFYNYSLYCIIPRCLRELWLFRPNSMFYCIIFFVKKTIFFHFILKCIYLISLWITLILLLKNVSAIFPECLGRTLLFQFNEFYSFIMLPLNSITLRYHNAEMGKLNRMYAQLWKFIVLGKYNSPNNF